jgi:hypothetical protein
VPKRVDNTKLPRAPLTRKTSPCRAFALAQLAEEVEREKIIGLAKIELYERELTWTNSFLTELRSKLAVEKALGNQPIKLECL